jgi:hypothetical protein
MHEMPLEAVPIPLLSDLFTIPGTMSLCRLFWLLQETHFVEPEVSNCIIVSKGDPTRAELHTFSSSIGRTSNIRGHTGSKLRIQLRYGTLASFPVCVPC